MEENIKLNHSLILEDRNKLILTGIKNVLTFDEETIILDSSYGKLAIKGMGLHIHNFNTETGDLAAEGRINALIYTTEEKSGGFFSKLLR